MDHKKSTREAIFKYHQKQLNQGVTREPKRKNKKPEKDVEKEVMEWARLNQVFLHVVEASSYDPISRRRVLSKAQAGFPDLVGNNVEGHACYIELKAKDRRGTVSEHQRLFLEKKIDQGSFSVVVDSVARLEQYWKGFWSLKNPDERKTYLRDCLPKKRKSRNDDDYLFKDE